MIMASTEMVSIKAGICRKILPMAARISTTAPINRVFCMPVKSRLLVVAMVAMVAKMAAVPPKAIMISWAPLFMLSTKPSMRDSIIPMKKVKAINQTMPAELFLLRSTANIRPKAPARNTMVEMPGDSIVFRFNCNASAAPRMVGIKEAASNQ